jgi:hypothetical protein
MTRAKAREVCDKLHAPTQKTSDAKADDKDEGERGIVDKLKVFGQALLTILCLGDERKDERYHKRPRTMSASHEDLPSANKQSSTPLTSVRVDSRLPAEGSGLSNLQSQALPDSQARPNSQALPNPQTLPKQYEVFELSMVELHQSLLMIMSDQCTAIKLGQSSESAVRIDPRGSKSGIFQVVQGQTAKNLARQAKTNSKTSAYVLDSKLFLAFVQELEEENSTVKIVYCQGMAFLEIPPDYLLFLTVPRYLNIKHEVASARQKDEEKKKTHASTTHATTAPSSAEQPQLSIR